MTLLAPAVEGRSVVLKPIEPQDHEAMYVAETTPYMTEHWWHGEELTFKQWRARVHYGSFLQLVAYDRKHPRTPLGRGRAYSLESEHQHAYFGMLRYRQDGPASTSAQGLFLFIDLLFRQWGLHKLYAEIPDWNLTQFDKSLDRLGFQLEGCKRGHWLRDDGSRADDWLYALYRSTWETEGKRLVEWALGNRGGD